VPKRVQLGTHNNWWLYSSGYFPRKTECFAIKKFLFGVSVMRLKCVLLAHIKGGGRVVDVWTEVRWIRFVLGEINVHS